MMRLCGLRFPVKWVYLQVYVSLILVCCAGFFLVQLLYCQSQVDLLGSLTLDPYACADLCPAYPATYGQYFCCTDYSFADCSDKFACLQPTIAVFAEKENSHGIAMACLFTVVPLLALMHIGLRLLLRRRLRQRQAQREGQRLAMAASRAGMPSLESFLHQDQENQCSICLAGFDNEKAIVLNCGHIFHNQCIRQWGARRRTCPVCRNQQ